MEWADPSALFFLRNQCTGGAVSYDPYVHLLVDGLIKIQHFAGDHSPRSHFWRGDRAVDSLFTHVHESTGILRICGIVFLHFTERFRQNRRHLWRRNMSKQDQAHAVDPLLGKRTGFVNYALCQSPGCFHPLHIVHGDQSLERCIGALPSGANHVAHRSIERIHVRLRGHAFHIGVHATAMERVAVRLHVMYGVAGWVTDLLPNAWWLVGLYARSTDFLY